MHAMVAYLVTATSNTGWFAPQSGADPIGARTWTEPRNPKAKGGRQTYNMLFTIADALVPTMAL